MLDRTFSVQYLHTDHLGSPVAATDDEGTVVGTQSFHPFGEARSGATGIFDTERSFTGQIFDSGTGLGFYNARSTAKTCIRSSAPIDDRA